MDISEQLGEIDLLDPTTDPDDLIEAQKYLEFLIENTTNPSVVEEAIWQYSCFGYLINRHSIPRMSIMPCNPWLRVKDGDPRAWKIFKRHYSFDAKKARSNRLIVGPGFKIVLILPNPHDPTDAKGLFVWRLERYRDDHNYGACCAVFRNESSMLASELITWAEEHAGVAWPFLPRFYTFIDTTKVQPQRWGKPHWGRSYEKAGWWPCGYTKEGLLTMESIFMPFGAQLPWRYMPASHDGPDYWPQRPYHFQEWKTWAGGTPIEYQVIDEELAEDELQLSLWKEYV